MSVQYSSRLVDAKQTADGDVVIGVSRKTVPNFAPNVIYRKNGETVGWVALFFADELASPLFERCYPAAQPQSPPPFPGKWVTTGGIHCRPVAGVVGKFLGVASWPERRTASIGRLAVLDAVNVIAGLHANTIREATSKWFPIPPLRVTYWTNSETVG